MELEEYSFELLVEKAESLAKANVWSDEALIFNSRILDHDDENIAAFLRLGRYYYEKNEAEKANEYFELVLKFEPRNRIALNSIQKHRLRRRKQDVRKIIDSIDDFGELLNLGKAFKKRGDLDGSVYALKKCTTMLPNNVYAINSLASAFRRAGQNEDALSLYKRSLAIEGNLPAKTGLAAIYRHNGSYEKSELMLNEVLGVEPENYYALMAKATLMLETRDIGTAERLFLVAAHNKPTEEKFLDSISNMLEKYKRLGAYKIVNLLSRIKNDLENEIRLGNFKN